MAKGNLYISSEGKTLVINGDTDKVLQNKFAKLYLRRNLSFNIEDGIIRLNGDMDVTKLMDHVSIIARYANCNVVYDTNINKDIKNFRKEKEEFDYFSKQALDIRNNHPNISEFRKFKDVLVKYMPKRTLYPLQMLSAYHMAFAQNECNFSVPGAGKTSIVYGAFAYLHSLPSESSKHVDYLLVIGPLSSFGSWENEYEECFGTKPKSMRLIGGLSKEQKAIYLHGINIADITLTSYQSVISMKEDLIYFVKKNKVMVILDEAHKIKNTEGAITASSTLSIAPYAKSRIILTGTPAPNGYEDLYNLYKFIWPQKDIISYTIGQLQNMTKNEGDARIPDLINKISPFFIRIRKSDLHIPPSISKVIKVEMSESQRSIYDTIERRVLTSLEEGEDSPYLRRIKQAKLIRLMQVSTNPELIRQPLSEIYNDDGLSYIESDEDKLFLNNVKQFISKEIPNKFKIAAKITEKIINEGGRVVIWANFIKNIDKMKAYLNSLGIPTRELYGATPVEGSNCIEYTEEQTRESIVKEFNSDNSSFNVVLANPFAVAESISLHKKCHNAIYLERSFNAAHFLQSKDRIHRYGLPPNTKTTYYFLVSTNSIDETIDKRLEKKEERLKEIMESMPIPLFDNVLKDGGIDDIKAIISDYEKRAKKI